MWRISALFVAAVLLPGCSSAVLETRSGPAGGRIPISRTLVVADVAEPYGSAVEDAIVRQLPGAMAAHALPGGNALARRALLAGLEEADLGAGWDAVVVATMGSLSTERIDGFSMQAGGAPAGPGLPLGDYAEGNVDNAVGSSSYAPIWAPSTEWLDIVLDVSVLRLADRREVYGMRIRQEGAAGGVGDVRELAPFAAARAARELKKARLFQ